MNDLNIHPSAFVDEGAVIGAGSSVWHFCHIMPGAVLGERCILGQNVVVAPGVRIGNNVKIQNNVSVYEGVELEDDVFCGPSCVFTNVINPPPRSCAGANTNELWCVAAPLWAPTAPLCAGPRWAAIASWLPAPWSKAMCPIMPSWPGFQPGAKVG